MRLQASAVAVGTLTLAVVWGAGSDSDDRVEIAVLSPDNWEDYAPDGKEADAIYGDAVIRNKLLSAVIAVPRADRNANMTVRDVGGALIDLSVRSEPNDQLSAFYPGRRKYPFRTWTMQADRSQPAEPTAGAAASGSTGRVSVHAEGTPDRPAVQVLYELRAGEPWLTVTTRYTNAGNKPLAVELEDDIRADGQSEDMVKAPNGISGLFWVHDRYWSQAYGVAQPGLEIEHNSNARESVLKYRVHNGSSTVFLAPGQVYQFSRKVFPGRNLLDVRAVAGDLHEQRSHLVTLNVTDAAGTPIPRARLEVISGGESLGTADTDTRGRLQTRLPAGEFGIKVAALGITVSGDARPLPLVVKPTDIPQAFSFRLEGYRPGIVSARITDEAGRPIPCKVEFLPRGDTPRPDFGPTTAEQAVRNVRYAPAGEFQQPVPPGTYQVVVSRGPEYDAVFTELTVPAGKTVPLSARLVRSVQTPGWVSSDFHSHSSPSGDNTSSQRGRVINLVCEHIEFAPCTEHNRISTYDEHIRALELAACLATTPGIELTGSPLPLNHQNAFPLVHRPRTQDGGAPLTDTDPEQQIERLALWDNRSEKLIQQNHPDLGWLFFDKDGDGTPDRGHQRSFAFMDVVEIHPIDTALDLQPIRKTGERTSNDRVFNWLQLLNQGYRIFGVVNTDAHYNYHGSGGLRNWIQSSTDDPAGIDPMEMVRAAKQGRLIMSNGPFLSVSLGPAGRKGAVTCGQEIAVPGGKAQLYVKVQCPNWLDIDRVFVLVNGRKHALHDYSRDKHADRFKGGVVKFEETLSLELDSDAHIIVVTGHEKEKLGVVMGPEWGGQRPAAMSNPIFVDVDGNGFKPNQDTLGHPLPVKLGS